MLKNLVAATILGLAALPLSAQERVQDQFHSVTAQLCFDRYDLLHKFLESNQQSLLFTGMGITNVITENGDEAVSPAMIMTYTDQDSGNFSIVGVYTDGVACLLTEGFEFRPYVD